MIQLHNKSPYWAISQDGMFRMMEASLPDGVDISLLMSNKDDRKWVRDALSLYINQRPDMQIHNGVAEIHLHGPMITDGSPVDLAMGATDYAEIIDDIELANFDDEVKSIILVCNTPGGTVQGIEETYDAILKSEKPIHAYVETSATSAGYYLAAACESITVSPSAISGNIGTILSYWDLTDVYESMGAKQETFTNAGADLKGTFGTRLSDSQREFVQAMVDEMGQQFQNRVLENRPNVDAEVFRAGWYTAEKAGALGLIDAVGTMEELKEIVAR